MDWHKGNPGSTLHPNRQIFRKRTPLLLQGQENDGLKHIAFAAVAGGVGVITQALLPHCSCSGRRWGGRNHPRIAATLL